MRITNSILWSVLGTGIPLLTALFSIPQLIDSLGMVRFGVLSIAWVLVGYFSFFDLGLGRAMTQLVAKKIGNHEETEIPAVIRSGIVAMAALGLVGGLVVAALSPWLVEHRLSIPEHMCEETLDGLLLLSASIPLVIVTTGMRGVLEGLKRFDLVNIIRAPLGALAYLGPLAILPFSNTLPAVMITLVAGRALFFLAYAAIFLRFYPALIRCGSLDVTQLGQLFSFGGWMTISNIVGPLLLYLGRLSLAMMVSAEAVAYFSTPYDVVVGLLLIPGIVVGVLFPIFTEKFQNDHASVGVVYGRWVRIMFLIMAPLTLLAWLAAESALAAWINADYAEQSYRVAQLIAVGVFINSFGHLSQALIQAYGRPDLTAKLHVAELIAYIPYMLWLIRNYGIEGAALSWTFRVAISTILLAAIANGCLSRTIRPIRKEHA
jgi:O-antigen/teichoic acid export membrane protein